MSENMPLEIAGTELSEGNLLYFACKLQQEINERRIYLNNSSANTDGIMKRHADPNDVATEERFQIINGAIVKKDIDGINDRIDALARIRNKTFGICEKCDSQIELRRLEAMSATTKCYDCAQEEDRLLKLRR